MNKYFANIGTTLNKNIPHNDSHYKDYITRGNINNKHTMFMGPTDQTEISNIINKIKPKTSKDKDDVSTKIVKEVAQDMYIYVYP